MLFIQYLFIRKQSSNFTIFSSACQFFLLKPVKLITNNQLARLTKAIIHRRDEWYIRVCVPVWSSTLRTNAEMQESVGWEIVIL